MIDLERLADWMADLRPVRTEPALCLRSRSPRSGCRACEAVCPVQAITLTRGVAVDPDACTACGLCGAACPSGALRMETPSEAALLTAVRQAQGSSVILACNRQVASLPAVVRRRLVVVPCVGSLTAELLAGMVADGKERLVLWQPDECGACPNGAGSRGLVEAAVTAVADLYPGSVTAGGAPALLAESAGSEAPAAPASGKSLEERLAGEDRRAFLNDAVHNAGSLVGLLFGGLFTKPKPEPVKRAPVDVKSSPRRRQVLAEALAAKPPGAEALVPGRAVTVSGECALCPVCSRLCPSGALRLQAGEEQATLLWQASQCTDCGLCRDVCPATALKAGERMTATRFRASAPEAVVTAEKATCSCGRTYWRTPEGPASCMACRLQSKG